MIVMPALDIRAGESVSEVADLPGVREPMLVARHWAAMGFRALHVTDLDAAAERGSNRALVLDVMRDHAVEVVQVAGGVRSGDDAEELVRDGATRVIVGARGVEEPEWLDGIAQMYPGEIVLAVSVRERRIVSRGWSRTLALDVLDVIHEINAMPLAAFMVTELEREGRMVGVDLFLAEDLVDASSAPVFVAGGVSSMPELRSLADRGIAGAVVGAALNTGVLDARAVANEFAE